MTNQVGGFLQQCRETIAYISKFLFITRAIEYQEESVNGLEKRQAECLKLKQEMIQKGDEDSANALLSIWHILDLYKSILKIWIDIKKDNMAQAWEDLVDAQMNMHSAISSHEVGGSVENLKSYLELIENMIFPSMTFASPRFITRRTTCSICKQDYASCEHIKGRPYMGILCSEVIEEAQLLEVSLVDNPSNKRARITSFENNGVRRDFLTYRIEKPNKSA